MSADDQDRDGRLCGGAAGRRRARLPSARRTRDAAAGRGAEARHERRRRCRRGRRAEPVARPAHRCRAGRRADDHRGDVTIAAEEFGQRARRRCPRSSSAASSIDARRQHAAARPGGPRRGPRQGAGLRAAAGVPASMQALRNAYVEQNVVDAASPMRSCSRPTRTLVVANTSRRSRCMPATSSSTRRKQAREDHRRPEGRRVVRGARQAVEGPERPERRRPRLLRPRADGAALRDGGLRARARRSHRRTPVQTEFGWHVIKVEEKRMSEPPTFAEVEEQLRNYRACGRSSRA